MGSGRAHSVASLVAAVPAGVAAWYFTADIAGALAVTAGCACGAILGPDADIAGLTEGEKIVIHRLPILGWLWAAYWWVYGKLLPHRGLSHIPILGTGTRLLYLWLFYALLALWQGWPLLPPTWFWPLAAGLACSDILHWIMDKCPI